MEPKVQWSHFNFIDKESWTGIILLHSPSILYFLANNGYFVWIPALLK
jgi:hypothetical protein